MLTSRRRPALRTRRIVGPALLSAVVLAGLLNPAAGAAAPEGFEGPGARAASGRPAVAAGAARPQTKASTSRRARRTTASLKVSRTTVSPGERVVLSGRLPVAARSGVRLERKQGRRWVRVAAQQVPASARFRFSVQPTRSTPYRVSASAAGTGRGTVTPVRRVRVAAPGPDQTDQTDQPDRTDRPDRPVSAVPGDAPGTTSGVPEQPTLPAGTPADGDAAGAASLTSSTGGDLGLLTDALSPVTSWTTTALAGGWVQLTYPAARRVTTVAVAGAPGGARLTSATVLFSDGSSLPMGAVLPDPGRPTVLSFPAKTVGWVRLRLDSLVGPGALALSDLATYQEGAPPRSAAGAAVTAPTTWPRPGCSEDGSSAPLVVLCPTYGSTVGAEVGLRLRVTSAYTSVRVEAWSGDGRAASTATRTGLDADGTVTVPLDLRLLSSGPLTVRVVASGGSGPPVTVHTQLVKAGPVSTGTSPVSPAAVGRSLVFAEEFRTSLSASRTGEGADYASAKPERTYGSEFGSAAFVEPAAGVGNLEVVGADLLRLSVLPLPAGMPDPQGWDRRHVGALLASARPGGSGFSAQYGYFEARMLLPAGVGTWPAFWLLPSSNLAQQQEHVAEIDALEHYGHNPTGACHTTHQYPDPAGAGVARCGERWSSDREALTWHTFGVDVRADVNTFYIDGRAITTLPQVRGGDQPMFWLANLALGGGYPTQLAGTRDRADLWVDWIRVYV